VARLKNSLRVADPSPATSLRAIKRSLASRTDRLPWPIVSERQAQLTRQPRELLAGERAKLGRVCPRPSFVPQAPAATLRAAGLDSEPTLASYAFLKK